MRTAVLFGTLLALAALPQAAHAGQTIQVSANYSLTVMATDDEAAMAAQEQKLKRSLYERAAGECGDLLATIALTCSITNISVSTQINRNYGQPPQVYANASITMQATMK